MKFSYSGHILTCDTNQPLTGQDIAECVAFAVSAPAHVQVAEILILATHQASGSVIHRE